MAAELASIKLEEFFPHPIGKVWRALTESSAIARWLMENDFEPTVGHTFTFRTQPIPAFGFDGIIHCEVTVVEPPRRLAYTWAGGALDTLVTYELASAEVDGVTGTTLSFEHSGFDLSNPMNAGAHASMPEGWRHIAERLDSVLDQMDSAA